MQDEFGDRLKTYEAVESNRRLDVRSPIYARIDGRGFSKFTRDMDRPYDIRMSRAMIETTRYLVEKNHARIGYTQSDEISLVFQAGWEEGSDVLFNGRVQKLVSVLAAQATIAFASAVRKTPGMGHYLDRHPHFDCRVFQLPNQSEAANAFLWRERDAVKNSVSMAARAYYSHNALDRKNGREMKEMLARKGIDFENDFPTFFKRGTWLRRVSFDRPFTEEELARIPEVHRPEPGTMVTRSEVREIEMPDFNLVKNRIEVIFDGADPLIDIAA